MEKTSRQFTVQFNGANIVTTVTNDPFKVEDVLAELCTSLAPTVYGVIGLDVEYKSNGNDNSVATLQLCHGNRCIVIQLSYLLTIPNSLRLFLANTSIRFVGVNIKQHTEKLDHDYGLKCGRCFELGLMADRIRDDIYYQVFSELGLSELAAEILGVVIAKPPSVARSDWGASILSSEQVKYAALDAYAAFAITKKLSSDYEKNYIHAMKFL